MTRNPLARQACSRELGLVGTGSGGVFSLGCFRALFLRRHVGDWFCLSVSVLGLWKKISFAFGRKVAKNNSCGKVAKKKNAQNNVRHRVQLSAANTLILPRGRRLGARDGIYLVDFVQGFYCRQ
jgi:hypothetical protein